MNSNLQEKTLSKGNFGTFGQAIESLKEGKKQQAETLFQEILQLKPEDVHSRLELGKLYVNQGKESRLEHVC